MKFNQIFITCIFTICSSQVVIADTNLHIMNAWINDAPPTLKHRAGYMEIHNMSNSDITLQSALSDAFETIELHESILKGEQVQMRQQENISIKAGETILFQPGGLHLMLMNKQTDLKLGEEVEVTLMLSNGEEVNTSFIVKKATTDSIHNHEHHHH